MTIIRVCARLDGTIAQVLEDSDEYALDETVMPQPVARFLLSGHEAILERLSDTKAVRWQNGELVIGAEVVASAAWIAAREAEIISTAQIENEDTSERAQLLTLAAAALAQIADDRLAIANGITAASAATTLSQMRTIILGMLTGMDNICQRQDREIRAIRAVIRSGLKEQE